MNLELPRKPCSSLVEDRVLVIARRSDPQVLLLVRIPLLMQFDNCDIPGIFGDCGRLAAGNSVKSSCRIRGVGTRPCWVKPFRIRRPSQFTKKKVLFLMIGPPRVAPN